MDTMNTRQSYGSAAKIFHWLTALLIVTLIPLGIIANGLPYDTSEALAQKAFLFSLHKTLGVTVFFVALARIVWALRNPKPVSLNPERRLEHWLAETVHWLLYGSLLLVPLTGWIHHASTAGFAPIWWPFGQNLPFVPKNEDLAALTAGLHIVFERVLALSIFLHVAGALKHHFVDRDATLRRMWFGKTKAGETAQAHRWNSVPLVSAITAWAIAVGIGGMLGVYAGHTSSALAAERPALVSDEAGNWTVTGGKVGLTITQFGSPVSGTFSDWTAAITFDPAIENGAAGKVDAQIAIASLTLGSVTAQALGPDYFDAETFPVASFKADILRQAGDYIAEGSLTIRDQTVPVSLPFSLTIDDNTASMQGNTGLNRMDFEVGTVMADESSLAFGVAVDIAVTAEKTE